MVKKTRAYGIQRPLEDVFPVPVIASRTPTQSDKNYELGQIWVDKTTGVIYGLSNVAFGMATWALLGPGASDVDTLTGDTGGAIPPVGGTITLSGGTNITTVGSANDIAFNLDDAITLATSVTCALYTTAPATELFITAATGQNISLKMGDDLGANKVRFSNSSDADVFAVNSDGSFSAKQLQMQGGAATDFIGTGTFSSGTVTIANTNITANDRIFIQRTAANASLTLGLIVYSINPGVAFTVQSKQSANPGNNETGDDSSFVYFIVRQN